MNRFIQRAFLQVRHVSKTRVPRGATTTISSLMSANTVPTADHMMPLEKVTELMAMRHLEAIPITKDSKVVGVFTEKDYFEKFLSDKLYQKINPHNVSVGEIATMSPELVTVFPDDTVLSCMELMSKNNLSAVPVIQHDGHPLGTISMLELTKEFLSEPETAENKNDHTVFSEPSHFPEDYDNVISLEASHSEFDVARNGEWELYLESTGDAEAELPTSQFSEPSDFPEVSAVHEIIYTRSEANASSAITNRTRERTELSFSEPSDFPEGNFSERA